MGTPSLERAHWSWLQGNEACSSHSSSLSPSNGSWTLGKEFPAPRWPYSTGQCLAAAKLKVQTETKIQHGVRISVFSCWLFVRWSKPHCVSYQWMQDKRGKRVLQAMCTGSRLANVFQWKASSWFFESKRIIAFAVYAAVSLNNRDTTSTTTTKKKLDVLFGTELVSSCPPWFPPTVKRNAGWAGWLRQIAHGPSTD